jgi:uncharacterized protein (DUF736 family)
MPFEQKNDTFTLFFNEKTSEMQPDLTGHGLIGDRNVKLACWKKVGKSGKEFFSCKVENKDAYKG